MFGSNGSAGAVCCGAEGASLQSPLGPGQRTITARDVAWPLDSPYRPAVEAGAEVPGLSVWPPRANRLGRRYYGLAGGVGARAARRGSFKGMRDLPLDVYGDGSGPYDPAVGNISPPIFTSGSGVGVIGQFPEPSIFRSPISLPQQQSPSKLQTILDSIQRILPSVPGVISAAEGKPYYNPAGVASVQQQQSQQPAYQAGAAPLTRSGAGLGIGTAFDNFIGQNPMVTLVLVGGVILLFMRPPSRR